MRSKSVKILMVLGMLILIAFQFELTAKNSAQESDSTVKPVEYNHDQLVMMAVEGEIAPPDFSETPYVIDPQGKVHVLPGTGSITYNFRTGDSAVNIAGDHVEPAVSLYNLGVKQGRSSDESRGLNTLACIGNRVKILTGEAKGAQGWVIGKHGGMEHVMVDFPGEAALDKLAIGDKMQIRAYGLGLELKNVSGVKVFSTGPELIDALTRAGMGVTKQGKLRIPVTHLVPAKILGSGLGSDQVYRGDYDIQLFDKATVKKYNLDNLRFGDIVAIIDADHSFGRIYLTGAISIGVISHSTSNIAGHGPGVTSLFTSPSGNIEPKIDAGANLAKLLNIR
ncbi:MAG: DUF4438 domain-containing protein [Acidobacteria bacterium]|jgi:hypothetical protein|nr:DUF4438 domain-containing protein [Acidobacteriota bacterium]